MVEGNRSRRSLSLLLTGATLSRLGATVSPLAVSFAVLDEGGSVGRLGLVLAFELLPVIVFTLLGGVLADRYSRKKVLISAELLRSLSNMILFVWLLIVPPPLYVFVTVQVMIGVGVALFQPSSFGLVAEVVGREGLQRANSYLYIVRSAAGIFGGILAGFMITYLGPAFTLSFAGLTYLASVGVLSRLALASTVAVIFENGTLAQLRDGWRTFRSMRWLWSVDLFAMAFHLCFMAPFQVLGVEVAKVRLGGATPWGFVLAAFSVGQLSGSALISSSQKVKKPLYVGVGILFLSPFPLIALSEGSSIWVLVVFTFVSGVSVGVFSPLFDTALQSTLSKEILSRVSAFDFVLSVASLPLGLAVVGAVAEAVGSSWVLDVGCLVTLLACVSVLSLREVRGFEVPPS